MEELRSTEVLDREILEDARKKAFKILKTADETVQSQSRRWEKKTQKDLAEIRKIYAGRTEKEKEEILARLPLDKRRLRSEWADSALETAMGSFLKSLSREDLFHILDKEFSLRLADCSAVSGEKPKLYYSSMTETEAVSLVDRISARPEMKDINLFKKGDWEREKPAPSSREGDPDLPALVLDIKELRITVSVEDAAREVLKEKRAELATTLMDEEVLND